MSLFLYQGPFILLLKATFEKLSCSLPPLVHSLLFSCITLVSSILIYNIFMSNIFLSGSWASFCLYLLPSNYQSLFSPDLLDVRKIFKVLVNTFLKIIFTITYSTFQLNLARIFQTIYRIRRTLEFLTTANRSPETERKLNCPLNSYKIQKKG